MSDDRVDAYGPQHSRGWLVHLFRLQVSEAHEVADVAGDGANQLVNPKNSAKQAKSGRRVEEKFMRKLKSGRRVHVKAEDLVV